MKTYFAVSFGLLLVTSVAFAAASDDVVYYTPLSKPLPWVLAGTCVDSKGALSTSAISLDVHTAPELAAGNADLSIKTNVCVRFLGLQQTSLNFLNFPLKTMFSLPRGKQGLITLSAAEVGDLNAALNTTLSPVLVITHDANAGSNEAKFTLHLNDNKGTVAGTISLYLQSTSYTVPIVVGPRITSLWPIASVEANAEGFDIQGSVTSLSHYISD